MLIKHTHKIINTKFKPVTKLGYKIKVLFNDLNKHVGDHRFLCKWHTLISGDTVSAPLF